MSVGLFWPDAHYLRRAQGPGGVEPYDAPSASSLIDPRRRNAASKEKADGIEVSAVDPAASMRSIENPELGEVADEVRRRLREVVEGL